MFDDGVRRDEPPQPLGFDRAGFRIRGTVVDHFGGPVAAARVVGDVEGGAPSAWTDDAGAFELWTRNGLVSVSASGYGSVRSRGPAPDEARQIALYPEAAIDGTVWDGDVAVGSGVEVVLRSKRGDRQVTATGDEGQFRFVGLGPGEFELRVVDAGLGAGLGAGPVWVRVPMGETVVRDLHLEPRATLSGAIGFAAGDRCPELSAVRVVEATHGHRFESRQVGAAAGEYSIVGLPVGTCALDAACVAAASPFEAMIEVSEAEELTLDVVFLDRAVAVSGVVEGVEDPTAWSVHARRVASDALHAEDRGHRMAQLGSTGEFTLAGLGEGTWSVTVTTHAMIDLGDGPGTEVVVGDEDITGLRLMPEASRPLTLALASEAGEPVAGQRVQVARLERFLRWCTTDADGACTVELPGERSAAELVVSVTGRRFGCEGEWRSWCRLAARVGAVELVVEDQTSLAGRLTDAGDGIGLSFALVEAVRVEDGRERLVSTTRTEEDGAFVLRGLPAHADDLQLRVTCPAGERPPTLVAFGSAATVTCE